MSLAEVVWTEASRACDSPRGSDCSGSAALSPGSALILLVVAGIVVYAAVSISNLVKKEPPPRQRNTRRPPRRTSPDDTIADRLEIAAQHTGDKQQPLAWMDIRSITGKLTFGSWISRWWSSGSYMRRRLLVSIGAALLTVAVVSVLVVLLSSAT